VQAFEYVSALKSFTLQDTAADHRRSLTVGKDSLSSFEQTERSEAVISPFELSILDLQLKAFRINRHTGIGDCHMSEFLPDNAILVIFQKR